MSVPISQFIPPAFPLLDTDIESKRVTAVSMTAYLDIISPDGTARVFSPPREEACLPEVPPSAQGWAGLRRKPDSEPTAAFGSERAGVTSPAFPEKLWEGGGPWASCEQPGDLHFSATRAPLPSGVWVPGWGVVLQVHIHHAGTKGPFRRANLAKSQCFCSVGGRLWKVVES